MVDTAQRVGQKRNVPALKNPSHELFAQHCATGTDKAEAYRTVYPKANPDSARSAGARLFANVCERVAELQAASATEKTLTMRERREFLARVVRADLDKLDLDKDGDLIQEKIVTTTEGGTTVKVKLPGKRECVMSDAELAGELVGKIDHTTGGEPLSVPVVNFHLPTVFVQRRGEAHARN